MDETLGDRLVAAFKDAGATEADIVAFCLALESGLQPDLSWIVDMPAVYDTEYHELGLVDQREVSNQFYSLLSAHGLTEHRAFRLLSPAELPNLCGFGKMRLMDIRHYCQLHKLELRGDQTLIVQAAALYGSWEAAPVTAVLSVVVTKRSHDRMDYVSIRNTLSNAHIVTIGQLVEALRAGQWIAGMSKVSDMLRAWMATQGL